ncbi:DUF1997 domain-containing protein [bacterium]|nr:DUF1997 domain-containing protein [bacterium]
MKVHRCHRLDLDLTAGTSDQLEAYLADPSRPLKALLNRKKVQQSAGGRFHYVSRPYSLLMFRLQPEVVFRARWADSTLDIEFEDCTIRGLGKLDSLVMFCCSAKISAKEKHLVAEADMSLELKSESSAVLMPRGLVKAMGEKALELIVERLEKRCRAGLVRGANKWVLDSR